MTVAVAVAVARRGSVKVREANSSSVYSLIFLNLIRIDRRIGRLTFLEHHIERGNFLLVHYVSAVLFPHPRAWQVIHGTLVLPLLW